MERLFACLLSDKRRLHDAMDRIRADWPTLFADSIGGWGFGYTQESQALVRKRPVARQTIFDVDALSHDLQTRTWMIHLLDAASPTRETPNVPPFRFRNWMGSVWGNLSLREPHIARETLSDALQSNLRGTSPEEWVFHATLDALHAFGTTPQRPLVPVDAMLGAMASTFRAVADLHTEPLCMAMVITHGRSMAVASLGDVPVFVRSFDDLPDPAHQRVTLRDRRSALRAAFVSVGVDLASPQWQRLESGEVFAIDSNWDTYRETLDNFHEPTPKGS